MRAYSTQRPVDIGTYPKNHFTVKEIVNFDNRTYCPEIGREAWGYIEYDGYLSRKTLDEYELTAQEYRIADEWQLIREAHEEARQQGPKKTIEVLLDALNANRQILKLVFCAYSKVRAHDGRISKKNREFYEAIPLLPGVTKWETGNPLVSMGLDDIHPAHVDQLMTELRCAEA